MDRTILMDDTIMSTILCDRPRMRAVVSPASHIAWTVWVITSLCLRVTFGPVGPEPWTPSGLHWQTHAQAHMLKPTWRGGPNLDADVETASTTTSGHTSRNWRSRRFSAGNKAARRTAVITAVAERVAPRRGRPTHALVGYLPPREMIIDLFPSLQQRPLAKSKQPTAAGMAAGAAGMAVLPLLFFNTIISLAGMAKRPRSKTRKPHVAKDLRPTKRRWQELEQARVRPEHKHPRCCLSSRVRAMRGPRRC